MSKIKTIPIVELFRLKSIRESENMVRVDHETFSIPDYQRGYRWEADKHVEALLNDVRDFMLTDRSSSDRYCLQPIVVNQSTTTQGAWEVIDGQQRLITLYLLLKALELPCFDIVFESREQSNIFLKNLIENNIISHNYPDFHFMSEAWEKINGWLVKQKEDNPAFEFSYKPVLYSKVHVIWYDIESNSRSNNISVFNRLNIGKIPLNDSELVKALLLTKIKRYYKDEVELRMRQAEICSEWQRMEAELRIPHKWYFFMGNVDKEYDSHIELIFDLLADNYQFKINDGHYTTYMWFERQIYNAGSSPVMQGLEAIRLWQAVKDTFARVNSWLGESSLDLDSTIYHYVGYLLASRKESLNSIYKLASGKSKSAFKKVLRCRVVDTVKDINLDDLRYENHEHVLSILLLFNVLTCLKISKDAFNRFPFDRYNLVSLEYSGRGGWSLEHIFAQNSENPIRSTKAAVCWLEDTEKSLKNISRITKEFKDADGKIQTEDISLEEIKNSIQQMKALPTSEIDFEKFNVLKDEVTSLFGEPDKHPLSNMALLSRRDNSALNNAIFPLKRDRIIQLEKEGRFIPPCTRNVFLKFYSASDSQPYYWGISDQIDYLNEVKTIINDFINNTK